MAAHQRLPLLGLEVHHTPRRRLGVPVSFPLSLPLQSLPPVCPGGARHCHHWNVNPTPIPRPSLTPPPIPRPSLTPAPIPRRKSSTIRTRRGWPSGSWSRRGSPASWSGSSDASRAPSVGLGLPRIAMRPLHSGSRHHQAAAPVKKLPGICQELAPLGLSIVPLHGIRICGSRQPIVHSFVPGGPSQDGVDFWALPP